MRSYFLHRRSISFAFLIAVLSWALAIQPATAQSPQQKAPAREPFGWSLKRPVAAESPALGSPDAKEKRAIADGSGQPEPEETIKVDTLLVSMDVVVTDQTESRFITGLKAEDFLIVEDNVPQQLATLTLGNDAEHLPRSIVLVFDWSGSQLPYLEESVKAAKTLVDQLARTDQMAIVTDSIFLMVDFTNDKKRLKSSLDALLKQTRDGWRGKSQQFSALLATLRELIDVKTRRPIIIFQTDGDEFIKLQDPPRVRPTSTNTYYISDIYAEVEKSRVKIYTVIPGEKLYGLSDDERLPRYRRVMDKSIDSWFELNKRAERPTRVRDMPDNIVYAVMNRFASSQEAAAHVAELSGGWAEFLDTPERAASIYGRILADINNHYIIGYYPTNKERDGQLRQVRIGVRNHPEYKVHGRQSYFATPR